MTTKTYLVIENNVVTNCIIWDGNLDTWTPPADVTMLVQADTQALVWQSVVVDGKITDYVLAEQLGAGTIGFTWDTTTQVLTTNELKPVISA